MKNLNNIAPPLLHWYKSHGRFNLPWQQPRSAYRVWISEIMLQQTQVTTVIPYFARFMQSFKDIEALAIAPLDAVLHQWTGLGYYARARNLHKAAEQILSEHHGEFPTDFEQVLALPGIGRSTAGAILAQAFGQRHAILDGNVKRVLTRYYAIEGWPGHKPIEQILWDKAELNTPAENLVDYTQAIMDLGATLCKRTKPDCPACPLNTHCQAHASGQETDFPTPKAKKTKPTKQTCMLMIHDKSSEHILLKRRPPSGIWGGLWSFPECQTDDDISDWCLHNLQLSVSATEPLTALRHTFSHYHLDIQPVKVRASPIGVMDSEQLFWYNTRQPDERGLPAPVKTLLDQLAMDSKEPITASEE
ncbi:A/G-specific adenine glycosylase [hydrothermal vent metagenome]|uniref:Adenine DNA glycosylase n=1 Tax=hydrothermal vent metagenome TaxID=652676 RepID=A0A3B1ANX0_9ZZZZ